MSNEVKQPKDKTLEVREYGDSLYIPLTKQLRFIDVGPGEHVDVTVKDGVIQIKKSEKVIGSTVE